MVFKCAAQIVAKLYLLLFQIPFDEWSHPEPFHRYIFCEFYNGSGASLAEPANPAAADGAAAHCEFPQTGRLFALYGEFCDKTSCSILQKGLLVKTFHPAQIAAPGWIVLYRCDHIPDCGHMSWQDCFISGYGHWSYPLFCCILLTSRSAPLAPYAEISRYCSTVLFLRANAATI